MISLSFFLLLPQDGRTALTLASWKEYVNVVEKLLAAGADPNHQDEVRNLVTRVMLIHVANAFVTHDMAILTMIADQ